MHVPAQNPFSTARITLSGNAASLAVWSNLATGTKFQRRRDKWATLVMQSARGGWTGAFVVARAPWAEAWLRIRGMAGRWQAQVVGCAGRESQ